MSRYDITAGIYDMRYEKEQTAKVEAAMKSGALKTSGLVLDVGCGTGLLFQHIAEKSVGIIGLDFSRKTLAAAKKRANKFRNVHLILADADHMPFGLRLFDAEYAFTLIQNMPRPEETLTEMRRVARLGSTVVVTGLKRCFSHRAFTSLLKTAGFRVVNLEDRCNLKCYVAMCQTHRS